MIPGERRRRVAILLGRSFDEAIRNTMQLTRSGSSLGHLTYCSNIHPGESWAEIEANLRRHVPGIREALCPEGEFGLGLRLSAAAASELAAPEALASLRAFLADSRCYLFTLNGFPHGRFHGTRVKENVYLPDWQDPERLRYTDELADLLAALLPRGQSGSISTVPGAFKSRVDGRAGLERMTRHLVAHAVHLARTERDGGPSVTLALEPEPCCFLETIAEAVSFFEEHLFAPAAIRQLGDALDTDTATAATLLRRHLTLCLDLCHAAVEFEDCGACLAALESAGIGIGKLQISAGLRMEDVTADSAERLRPFVDATYLHQVVERREGTLRRFTDLPEALASLVSGAAPREWRVHFHVPVFLDDLGDFSSTQFFIREALERHRRSPLSEHLEVETYTWDVLPARYRHESVEKAIVRELAWVRRTLLGS